MAYFADNFSVLSLFSVSSVVKFFVFQPKRIHFLIFTVAAKCVILSLRGDEG